MPRAVWPLVRGRPTIRVNLALAQGNQYVTRILLADTGAGATGSGIDFLLENSDCLLSGGARSQPIVLRGAYSGSFPTYAIHVEIPQLGFSQHVPAVGIPAAPTGLGGIACFCFLNRFGYGNFGDPAQFGLET
jgi:hypothetical protein